MFAAMQAAGGRTAGLATTFTQIKQTIPVNKVFFFPSCTKIYQTLSLTFLQR